MSNVFLQSFELSGFSKSVKLPFGSLNSEAMRLWKQEIDGLVQEIITLVNESNHFESAWDYIGKKASELSSDEMHKKIKTDLTANPFAIIPDGKLNRSFFPSYGVRLSLKKHEGMTSLELRVNEGVQRKGTGRFIGYEWAFDVPKAYPQYVSDFAEKGITDREEVARQIENLWRAKSDTLALENSRMFGHLQQYWRTMAPGGLSDNPDYWKNLDEMREGAHSDISLCVQYLFINSGFFVGSDLVKKVSTLMAVAFPHEQNPTPAMLIKRAGYDIA